jgi:outer membrane protein TolC
MKRWVSLRACALAVATILSSAAAAQPGPLPAAGLGAAVEAAWQRAVAAREADSQRRRAQAERTVASSWAAGSPSVELGYRDDRWHSDLGSREAEVGLAWPLWLPSQKAASGKVADASLALAAAAERAARLRLSGEVLDAYWSVRTHEVELAAVESQLTTLHKLADDVDRRVRAGDLARADALAARAEHLDASAQRLEAAQRVAAARLLWAELTGMSALPQTGDAALSAATSSLDDHPELQAARLAAEQARSRLDLTLASRREAPELLLGLRQELPQRGASTQHSVLLRLRIAIGTAARNEPLQAAAVGELEVAQAAEQRTRDRLAAQLEIARSALAAATQQLGAERERAALLRERATLIDRSFRAGETSLPDTLRALAAAAQAEAALARQTAALGLAQARLQHALGLLP